MSATEFTTRDVDTELVFNPYSGVIELQGPRNQEAAIFLRPGMARELAEALLQYADAEDHHDAADLISVEPS